MKRIEDFLEMLKERGLDYVEKCKKKKINLTDDISLPNNVVDRLIVFM